MTTGIYVHIPFCRRKCLYCDFASFPGREEAFSRYVDLVCGEAREKLNQDMAVDSVFFGGGTPTVLTSSSLVRILETIRASCSMQNAEITVEMNPGTVTKDNLKELKDAGVNRVSVGIQSFSDRLLRKLGRIHNAAQALETVRAAYETGFGNISVDLMYGIPEQTLDDWKASIDSAMLLPIQHLSCYSLIVEEGTPFAEMYADGSLSLPGEEEILEMEAYTKEKLISKGFCRYEVSNYAIPGYESRHNMKYWKREPYIGLGAAAHSFLDNTRLANTADLDQYMQNREKNLSFGNTVEQISEKDACFEEIMLGLRLVEGVTLSDSSYLRYGNKMKDLQQQGLLLLEGKNVRLTESGMDVMNSVLTQFIDM